MLIVVLGVPRVVHAVVDAIAWAHLCACVRCGQKIKILWCC